MPLDGIVVRNIVYELNNALQGGRIDKIYQPARDEVIIAARAGGKNLKLLLTSNASFPRMHITDSKSENPQSPPMFCMTLRKHLGGGKITGFEQPALERIIEMNIEALDEMGDLSEKKLVLEIMGKHSNIILINGSGVILDSIKRVGLDKSSVREILPGRSYEYPPSQDKMNPLTAGKQDFLEMLTSKRSMKVTEAIYKSFCGFSPLSAAEACVRADVIPSDYVEIISNQFLDKIFDGFSEIITSCRDNNFNPEIVYENGAPLDFSSIKLTQFDKLQKTSFSDISSLLEEFYGNKTKQSRLKQKTADLRKLLQNNIERCVKKRDVFDKTLKDSQNMEELRLCGELLTSFMSDIQNGAEYYEALNYHDDNAIKKIRLRPDLTPSQNATRYFEKYGKSKRQKSAAMEQIIKNEAELSYLEGILSAIFSDITENDIQEIKQELFEQGYIKKNPAAKGMKPKKSQPLHFTASDGSHIYVGKNNRQNDELTLKFADFNDMWLHTKDIPGSHVILKTDGKEPSVQALNEAALLAAFYSKARSSSSVPVDYTQKRNVKKPGGAKPGMVIYERHKTAYVTPSEESIAAIKPF